MSENMEPWRHLDGSGAVIDQPHMRITFQHGSPVSVGKNGCTIEDVIEVLVQKLLDFQGRDLACLENAVALYHLSSAKEALMERTARRTAQGVRGSREAHTSSALEAVPPDLATFPSFH